MPEKYRNYFACQDRLITYRFHKGVYEAHYRKKGIDVFACAKDFNEMRKKFGLLLAEALMAADPTIVPARTSPETASPSTPVAQPVAQTVVLPGEDKLKGDYFMDDVKEWLSIKKQTVKPLTYQEYERIASFHFEKDCVTSAVDRGYTDYSQEYLTQEAQKINYTF